MSRKGLMYNGTFGYQSSNCQTSCRKKTCCGKLKRPFYLGDLYNNELRCFKRKNQVGSLKIYSPPLLSRVILKQLTAITSTANSKAKSL